MCGIAGIVTVHRQRPSGVSPDIAFLKETARQIREQGAAACKNDPSAWESRYLGGESLLGSFVEKARDLKSDAFFHAVLSDRDARKHLGETAENLSDFIEDEAAFLADEMGRIDPADAETVSDRLESLRDAAWCIRVELLENIKKTNDLFYRSHVPESVATVFKRINTVLNSLDRLEVRGRDSAGISLLFILDRKAYDDLTDTLDKANFSDTFRERSRLPVLVNRSITVRESGPDSGEETVAVAFTYKVAAEIGSLGDNVAFLRTQIKNDPILQALVNFPLRNFTISSHTRWASVGAITEPNCHPVDNRSADGRAEGGIFHVCLNGDIDNYLKLKEALEGEGITFPDDVTTDTKIIPLQIEKYMRQGHAVEEAFRLAVNGFEGSHAVSMHTDLAPGKLFLAQKGSGQAIFVGLAEDHYMSASEVYGFIEETSRYLKMDGEKAVQGKAGMTQGQIFILDQNSEGGLSGIRAGYYDGTPLELQESDIKETAITSRDIDRQGFPHYFLKEISESPVSVEKTLQNRWRIKGDAGDEYAVSLDQTVVPQSLRDALADGTVRRIFFVGQGTAGIAAQACADILTCYLNDTSLLIDSLKASELSGFQLQESEHGMRNTLVVAISQSGTTTDTNRTVDMVRERGAHTLAIVNRRDSDITFKVDGVLYTSSGRDIEMSVASTKAFYSQIVAGALLGLFLAHLTGRRDDAFVAGEMRSLLALPAQMRKILFMKESIRNSASRLALSRTYWAAVGSGPNKTSADEIRIKLSELCYKTISSDYVEDKKHIDLSSEPLIIVCAAGTRSTVIGDIIKDTAIFRAHKAVPVLIVDEGETRFTPYAADVFRIPPVSEHLAPVLNTLVGHIWGYYAALAINEGSRFLYDFREDVREAVAAYLEAGHDIYELILDKTFRERMAAFYTRFRRRCGDDGLAAAMGKNAASDLILLLKYLSGRLPVTDFEIDFGIKGTARNMLDVLYQCLGTAINTMARPIDAIKHQAKTVTVGTSRIVEKMDGPVFEKLEALGFRLGQLIPSNVIVLKHIQRILQSIDGVTLYRIRNLNLLGEPTDESVIDIIRKEGSALGIPSRVATDRRLKGSKRTIIQRGNVYIGKGRKDNRSILCIPLNSEAPGAASRIENLALFHISFMKKVPLAARIKALGGKYEHIKNIVQENNVSWDDRLLDMVEIEELFGRSAEKIGEFIVSSM